MKSFLQKTYLAAVYGLLYFPILVLVVFSVNQAKFSLQWKGFSFRWYIELFHDYELWSAFLNSVFLGLSASLIASILGLLACVHLFLYGSRHRRSLFAILLLLIIIPDLVLGVALLIFFNVMSIPLGFFSLLIAHITFCIPFVVLTINSRIHTLDANIYFCALDLGASRLTALVKVLLPLLWPAVMSAFLLCFTLSFDDVIISYFVAGPDYNILPLTIFSLVRAGVTPELNALCSITFFISMALVVTAHQLTRKSI
ncbi:ABC transporter permease subunit [Legionella londiniensis]|uniref:Spermidine/putrescine transport system permease potC n=1 Tax=Legionella londiniensis TaxID=45068 RepID=A0A0W0VQE6_9GAMM|nr:ABC transporter permease subunit [Legionella londiniensis]KTD22370.1 spermidine/putrescine transport system permease potC [Legionella londiniensis]STX93056.1 spermidine/putrescine transport system permease potC [Legionella londiniensis]